MDSETDQCLDDFMAGGVFCIIWDVAGNLESTVGKSSNIVISSSVFSVAIARLAKSFQTHPPKQHKHNQLQVVCHKVLFLSQHPGVRWEFWYVSDTTRAIECK